MRRTAIVLSLLLAACTEQRSEVSVEVRDAENPAISRKTTVEVSPETAKAVRAEILKPDEAR